MAIARAADLRPDSIRKGPKVELMGGFIADIRRDGQLLAGREARVTGSDSE